ncbi:undecaprenyl-diphosphate phosphatase [Rubellicoccus peritrichatus]|uniref:Undecaprenyl-diphosphatase n=1 Tax=Rubellicoccus peritrichatus TaxID=3080537 RepID=A0AAQ3L688_9BACT|nr:undecaprenyl-diphosphate phosphatase [Puniceicoccus sp. CR14]WOO39821.1 undecaprenyl-diphosphate phosphatase [Puniceicoccus sp. CR14]
MSFKLLHVSWILVLSILTLNAESEPSQSVENSPTEERQLTYFDAFVLGVVEGITEYLPVSSTGHLILTNRFLGLEGGEDEASIQLAEAANAYAIVIQGGAILAVIILYWKRLVGILMGLLGRDPRGLRLFVNLIVAFLPAAVLGLLLDDFIESKLFGPLPVIIALVGGAILMLFVENWRKKQKQNQGESLSQSQDGPDLYNLGLKQCFMIGLLQCVAMWPGTSRSMMTIVGGYIAGLSPKLAAEFSFLLGLITLSAASGYKVVTNGKMMMETLSPGPVLFGIIIATIAAALAITWLVNFLSKHGLAPFAWYRIGLAIVVAIVLYI